MLPGGLIVDILKENVAASSVAAPTLQWSGACLQGTDAKVLETRKTVPCLRVPDKWAVLIGGGANHRMGLFDMVMIKDNHVTAAGGVAPAIQRAQVGPLPPAVVPPKGHSMSLLGCTAQLCCTASLPCIHASPPCLRAAQCRAAGRSAKSKLLMHYAGLYLLPWHRLLPRPFPDLLQHYLNEMECLAYNQLIRRSSWPAVPLRCNCCRTSWHASS